MSEMLYLISQAKAALFAAGCFCDISDDFPSVVLEMLVNMMASSEVLLPIRLAAVRVYAKVGNSFSTATRAYKVLPLVFWHNTFSSFGSFLYR